MTGRLFVVSNRIPTEAEPSGGLVVALHEALSQRGGVWIGSSGTPVAKRGADTPLTCISEEPYTRLTFDLTEEEYDNFYLGYSNSVLWPLFHRRSDLISFSEPFAEGYRAVNARVARLLTEQLRPDDVVWVQDYHFLPLAYELRSMSVENRIGFFLHIPFPNPSDLPALPQSRDMPGWLAAYDLVGLQTQRDVVNCREMFRANRKAEFLRDGSVLYGLRKVNVLSFPIGIDARGFAETAATSEGGDRIAMTKGQKLVLGVDRLDYSKGLVDRFEGFATFLKRRQPDDPRATLLQIATPSREDVEAYQDIRTQLEMATGSINGQYGELDWTPIRYIHRTVPRDDLAGIYRRGDVMIVTPLADGMNLVAKEFVACQDPDDPGVLILSHFAGAAEQLEDALMVNPYDHAEVAVAIETALTMPLSERKRRHARLLRNVMEQDIEWWTDCYLSVLTKDRRASAA